MPPSIKLVLGKNSASAANSKERRTHTWESPLHPSLRAAGLQHGSKAGRQKRWPAQTITSVTGSGAPQRQSLHFRGLLKHTHVLRVITEGIAYLALRPREALLRLPETAPIAEGRGHTAEGGLRASTSSKMASFSTYVSPAEQMKSCLIPLRRSKLLSSKRTRPCALSLALPIQG